MLIDMKQNFVPSATPVDTFPSNQVTIFRGSSVLHCFLICGIQQWSRYHFMRALQFAPNLCPFSNIKMCLPQQFFCTGLLFCIEMYYTNPECSVCDFICLYYLESTLRHWLSKSRNDQSIVQHDSIHQDKFINSYG